MSILNRCSRNISVLTAVSVVVAAFFLLLSSVNIAHAAVIVTPPTLCPNVDSSGAIECANGAGAEPVWCGGQCQSMPTVNAPYGRVNCDSCTAICPSANPYECPSAPEKCQDRNGTDCAAANRSYTCNTGGGISQTCGGCVSGYLDCTGTCKSTTPQGCEPGQVWDTCSQMCTDPYIKAYAAGTGPSATPQSADANIGGDLNIASGKAIRVDTATGDSILNIGNWGGAGAVLVNVVGNIDADDFCWNNGASCIASGDASQWDDVTGGINYAGGSVGIGNANPTSTLDVNGTVQATGFRLGGVTLTSWSAASPWTVSGSNVYRSSGAIGVGTSSPTAKVTINQTPYDIFGHTPTNAGLLLETTYSGDLFTPGVYWRTTDTHPNEFTGGIWMQMGPDTGTAKGYDMIFDATIDPASGISDNGHMRLKRDGSLLLSGDLKVNGSINLGGVTNSSWPTGPWTESGGNVYRSSGNVGIGTTTPTQKLDVNGAIKAATTYYLQSISALYKSGDIVVLNNLSGKEIRFTQAGVNRMMINSVGNVGIGTTTPTKTLDVNGDVSIIGRLNVGLNSSASGSFATAIGRNSTAQTFGSTAIGYSADALTNSYASAFGYDAQATGAFSTAINRSTASGYYGSSMGLFATASGAYSTAIGFYATASGSDSYAFGKQVTASGSNAFTIGRYLDATNLDSVVIGRGYSNTSRLVNNDNYSIYMGSYSDTPTLVIGSSAGPGTFGNVGIGTKTPAYTLDVKGYGRFSNGIGAGGQAPTSGYGINARGTTMGGLFTDTDHGTWSRLAWYVYGLYTPWQAIAGGHYNYSSRELKTDIEEIDGALDIVRALRGVRFDWKDGVEMAGAGERQVGMIAEEVHELLPEIVDLDPDDPYYTFMDYGKLTPVLVEAIKEQQEQIEGLESEIADLRERIGALDAVLSR